LFQNSIKEHLNVKKKKKEKKGKKGRRRDLILGRLDSKSITLPLALCGLAETDRQENIYIAIFITKVKLSATELLEMINIRNSTKP
jgi:hypothetical protein